MAGPRDLPVSMAQLILVNRAGVHTNELMRLVYKYHLRCFAIAKGTLRQLSLLDFTSFLVEIHRAISTGKGLNTSYFCITRFILNASYYNSVPISFSGSGLGVIMRADDMRGVAAWCLMTFC